MSFFDDLLARESMPAAEKLEELFKLLRENRETWDCPDLHGWLCPGCIYAKRRPFRNCSERVMRGMIGLPWPPKESQPGVN